MYLLSEKKGKLNHFIKTDQLLPLSQIAGFSLVPFVDFVRAGQNHFEQLHCYQDLFVS